MSRRVCTEKATDTPRVDEIAERHEGEALDANDANAQYNDLLDLARQLERELTEAKEPPPCPHTTVNGTFWSDGRAKQWCAACGADMPIQRLTLTSGVYPGTICEGMRNIAVQQGRAGCQHEWHGPGEMPSRYTCGCGTVVFRSHEDAD